MAEDTLLARVDERVKSLTKTVQEYHAESRKVQDSLVASHQEHEKRLGKVESNWFWVSMICAFISTAAVNIGTSWIQSRASASQRSVMDKTELTTPAWRETSSGINLKPSQ